MFSSYFCFAMFMKLLLFIKPNLLLRFTPSLFISKAILPSSFLPAFLPFFLLSPLPSFLPFFLPVLFLSKVCYQPRDVRTCAWIHFRAQTSFPFLSSWSCSPFIQPEKLVFFCSPSSSLYFFTSRTERTEHFEPHLRNWVKFKCASGDWNNTDWIPHLWGRLHNEALSLNQQFKHQESQFPRVSG